MKQELRKELGLGDLVLAQVLCVVGSTWVGIAAKLGRAHLVFWVVAMAMFYLPLAGVVIYLNRLMPLEGGLYQWAKEAFGEMAGFLIAWNLWAYAVVVCGAILFVVPTDLAYMMGASWSWVPASHGATLAILGALMGVITVVAIAGLNIGKWLHNAGSVMILTAYAILLALPFWALAGGRLAHFDALPVQLPPADWFHLAIFGQMTVGALSGFEYVAIMAGECRSAARTIGQSVVISAPVIAVMFILGTSTVLAFVGGQPINVIGPIPQTFRAALGSGPGVAGRAAQFGIFLLMARAVSSASLIFTGLTRLPMTAGWDNLAPKWFTRLDPVRRTPVNSILFTTALVMALILLSLLGVHEQEASQLLAAASIVHYAIVYVALFAIPLFGGAAVRAKLPVWLKIASGAGLVSSLIALLISAYPVVDVVSRAAYATKVCAVVAISNMTAVILYRMGQRRATL